MRSSIRLNNDLSVSEYIELVQVAEDVGFDQFWIANDLFLRSAPAIVAALSGVTSTIELGIGVLNPYTINPAELATFASTMDEISDCRFNLGLAAGASEFLQWVGLEHGKPLTAIRETVMAIRALQSGRSASVDGEHLRWSDRSRLGFEAPRMTPIYLGATGPKMLELAGEIADGVLPLLPPELYGDVKAHVDRGIRRGTQAPEAFDFVGSVWVSLDEDPEIARRVLAEKVAYYGQSLGDVALAHLGLTPQDFAAIDTELFGNGDMAAASAMVTDEMLRVGVVGDPGALVERLRPLVDAGMAHVSFGPPLGDDRVRAIGLLGERVLPILG